MDHEKARNDAHSDAPHAKRADGQDEKPYQLDKIDKSKLGLLTPGTIKVGTLSDAPPSIFIDKAGNFTGFDM